MPAPINHFKAALKSGQLQIGFWLALANAYTAEIAGGAGFDWLLLDGEHAPNDIPLLTAQLQALSASPSHPVVRVPIGETWMLKQVLDIGAQTILVPMVESGAQAAQLVKAMRYPPHGVRGVGAALARASSSTLFLTICKPPMTKCVCSCKSKAAQASPRWKILPTRTAWTACSSARQTSLQTWDTSVNLPRQKFNRQWRKPLNASSPAAKRQVF